MIYAIAAYSITLGVLALYLVLLQHRQRQYADERASLSAGEPLDPRKGFNAGACLLAPLWMLGHGMPIPGAALLLLSAAAVALYLREMWIPLIFVSIVPLAAGAALGFVGNRIAAAHTGLDRAGPVSESQLPWALAGITLHAFVLPWAWYFSVGTA